MNRATFYGAIRPSFGGKLTPSQVSGVDAILDAAEAEGLTDPHHVAFVLANVRRETGSIMAPIKETVMAHHKDQNPSDAEVIRRLDAAFAKGQLPWVKSPYWRRGFFGRGQIQITHEDNYRKFSPIVGVDLARHRDKALVGAISAKIAVVGMRDGMFTGKALADFSFPSALDLPPSRNPRRIVNGADGSDGQVAGWHRQFYDALVKAGWGTPTKSPPSPHQKPTNTAPAPGGLFVAIAAAVAAIAAYLGIK